MLEPLLALSKSLDRLPQTITIIGTQGITEHILLSIYLHLQRKCRMLFTSTPVYAIQHSRPAIQVGTSTTPGRVLSQQAAHGLLCYGTCYSKQLEVFQSTDLRTYYPLPHTGHPLASPPGLCPAPPAGSYCYIDFIVDIPVPGDAVPLLLHEWSPVY